MKHRKLRIAWSVAWGIVAVMLLVMWMRTNGGDVRDAYKFHLSGRGLWIYFHGDSAGVEKMTVRNSSKGLVWTWFGHSDLPHAFTIVISGVSLVAALSWITQRRLHFSLRTLLIATTLVAVALGAAIYVTRK